LTNRGLTKHSIRSVARDSLATNLNANAYFSMDVSASGRFAYTHAGMDYVPPDTNKYWIDHVGCLGRIEDQTIARETNFFHYAPPLGPDTVTRWDIIDQPSVSVCDDKIIWAYWRFDTDTVMEVWVTLTDWDMGEGVGETPDINEPLLECPTICRNTLNYSVNPDTYADIDIVFYDVSGRVVNYWNNLEHEGELDLSGLSSGVYYLKILEPTLGVHRIVVVR
jgi:hypothetical protein